MEITHGKTAETLGSAAGQVQQQAGRVAQGAKHGICKAGDEIGGFVQRRPVETALLSAAAACLITGLAFWFSRPD